MGTRELSVAIMRGSPMPHLFLRGALCDEGQAECIVFVKSLDILAYVEKFEFILAKAMFASIRLSARVTIRVLFVGRAA